MREMPVTLGNREMRLDLCRRCQFVWFDPREFEELSRPEPHEVTLPLEARERVAVAQMEHQEQWRRQQEEREMAGLPPDEPWKWIPAMLGLPVKDEAESLGCWPWVTWGLSALLVLIFAATANNLEAAVEQFGLVPSQFFHGGAVRSLTNFFIHAGIWHLAANVYFLLIFGDNVEDYLGRLRYVGLLLLSTLGADLLHILLEPRADIPAVGASGGISGVVVFFALQFPHARLGFLVRYFYVFRWLYLPAWVALVLWFLLQFVGAFEQIAGASNVSSLAHLGGAAVGLLAWFVWRRRS
jgi:membrane associated rhomboid family serine protease